MLFHSIEFIFVFLPITWLVFFLLIRRNHLKATCMWLVIASLGFYSWWNPPYVILIVSSILINFGIGRLLHLDGSKYDRNRRTAILYFGLLINIGALAYFKYANFFVENINSLLGASFNIERIILPLAISFFTFQQIVYIIDAYRLGNRQYSLLEYSFFVLFFPHLIAGPIIHHYELLPQIARERWQAVRRENLQVGCTIFAIGLYKKMVLADGCGAYSTPLFNLVGSGAVLSTENAWIAALSYTFQLYFDFSGYSDMAIGISRLFGIQLPANFNSPYRATSMIEFWRRWHMTLSKFLREYIYIPLGGNRKGVFIRYTNLLITMLIGGLWHGAGWNFIIWGAIHGFCLIINHLFRDTTRQFFEQSLIARKVFPPVGWTLTMLAVIVSWVFFRSGTYPAATSMLQSMFLLQETARTPVPYNTRLILSGDFTIYWLAIVGLIAVLAPSTQQYLRNYNPTLYETTTTNKGKLAWRPTFAHGLIIGILVLFTIRRYFSLTPTEFIYFNF
jgi:alginate O-acetyltransferase complex protein AlgI